MRHFSSSISEEIVSAHCVVEGTRRYDVSLRITHSALVAQCTCPRCADTGSCKHIAAALLRLEQQMKEVSVTQVMGTVKERRELMDAVADGSEEGILTKMKANRAVVARKHGSSRVQKIRKYRNFKCGCLAGCHASG